MTSNHVWPAMILGARLISTLGEGASFSSVKQKLGTTAPTISRWKQRFLASGIDGLDTSHPGQTAPVLSPKLRARILSATGKKPRDGSTHWSCRKLAAALGASKDTVPRSAPCASAIHLAIASPKPVSWRTVAIYRVLESI
jgi:hypothetical protein